MTLYQYICDLLTTLRNGDGAVMAAHRLLTFAWENQNLFESPLTTEGVDMTQAEKIDALKKLCAAHHDPKVRAMATNTAIDWAALIALLEQLLPLIIPFLTPATP
jgi:hypothetical protein